MKSNKSMVTALATVLILTLAVPGLAFAADYQDKSVDKASCKANNRVCPVPGMNVQERGSNYVDSNEDGACDYCLRNGRGEGFSDADGDGLCDYQGTCQRAGQGFGYGDADRDGVCDTYEKRSDSGFCYGGGQGTGYGQGYGQGMGQSYGRCNN